MSSYKNLGQMENQPSIAQPNAVDSSSTSLASRRAFMRLPLEERRRILAQQAEEMLSHYQHDTEWKELETGDFIDY